MKGIEKEKTIKSLYVDTVYDDLSIYSTIDLIQVQFKNQPKFYLKTWSDWNLKDNYDLYLYIEVLPTILTFEGKLSFGQILETYGNGIYLFGNLQTQTILMFQIYHDVYPDNFPESDLPLFFGDEFV